jgi:hypothetical protein
MRPWRDWPDWITFPIIGLLFVLVPFAVGLALSLLQFGGGWTVGVAALIGVVAYAWGVHEGRRVERRAHEASERARVREAWHPPPGPVS